MTTSLPIYSANSTTPDNIKIYRAKDGTVPFWDDPFVIGGVDRPTDYMPVISTREVFHLFYTNILREEDKKILIVLRDMIACNENQLRRVTKPFISSNKLSTRLRTMWKYGLVDKWTLRTKEDEEKKMPVVWDVGIAGYIFLKHMSTQFVLHPDKLATQGLSLLQKYVALNEIRTQLYEYQSLRAWSWSTGIENGRFKPAVVSTMIGGFKGEVNLCIERAQQSKPFINYIYDRLKNWKEMWNIQEKGIKFNDLPLQKTLVMLSVSTDEVAKKLIKRLPLDDSPFDIKILSKETTVKSRSSGSIKH